MSCWCVCRWRCGVRWSERRRRTNVQALDSSLPSALLRSIQKTRKLWWWRTVVIWMEWGCYALDFISSGCRQGSHSSSKSQNTEFHCWAGKKAEDNAFVVLSCSENSWAYLRGGGFRVKPFMNESIPVTKTWKYTQNEWKPPNPTPLKCFRVCPW